MEFFKNRGLRESEKDSQQEKFRLERRSVLKGMLGLGAVLAVETFASDVHAKSDRSEKKLEDEEKSPLETQWNFVVEEGIREFIVHKEYQDSMGVEKMLEIEKAIRSFDIGKYIAQLSELTGLEKKLITGKIGTLKILPAEPKSGMAQVVYDTREMTLFVGNWMSYKEKIHVPTVHAVLRHELAHVISFDEEIDVEERVPFQNSKKQDRFSGYRATLSSALYEGISEYISFVTEPVSGEKARERGYRGGGLLSAYLLGELIGKENLIRAYLKRDNGLLGKYIYESVGESAWSELNKPVFTGNLEVVEELGFIYNTFRQKEKYSIPIESFLQKANKDGVPEHVMHHVLPEGTSLTTHVFVQSDADDALSYGLNVVGQTSFKNRFGERFVVKKNGKEFQPKETLSFVFLPTVVTPEKRETYFATFAKELKNSRAPEDQNSLLPVCLVMGIDKKLEKMLEYLATFEQGSPNFVMMWKDINQYMRVYVQECLNEIFEKSGINNERK